MNNSPVVPLGGLPYSLVFLSRIHNAGAYKIAPGNLCMLSKHRISGTAPFVLLSGTSPSDAFKRDLRKGVEMYPFHVNTFVVAHFAGL